MTASSLWRWTDGNAVLELSVEAPAVLEIVLAGSQDYSLGQDLEAYTAHATGLAPAHLAAA